MLCGPRTRVSGNVAGCTADRGLPAACVCYMVYWVCLSQCLLGTLHRVWPGVCMLALCAHALQHTTLLLPLQIPSWLTHPVAPAPAVHLQGVRARAAGPGGARALPARLPQRAPGARAPRRHLQAHPGGLQEAPRLPTLRRAELHRQVRRPRCVHPAAARSPLCLVVGIKCNMYGNTFIAVGR